MVKKAFSVQMRMSQAEALILRSPHAPALPAGAAVEVIPLGELGI
jgi:molybdopterin molybdotransferase